MKVTHPDAEYLAFLKEGRFMLPRSRETGRHIFHPRVVEPGTGCTDLDWVPASGRGTVYSVTTIHPRPPAAPYNVSLIDLEEGVRLMSRVEGLPPDQVRIGQPVTARIDRTGPEPVLVFDPDPSA